MTLLLVVFTCTAGAGASIDTLSGETFTVRAWRVPVRLKIDSPDALLRRLGELHLDANLSTEEAGITLRSFVAKDDLLGGNMELNNLITKIEFCVDNDQSRSTRMLLEGEESWRITYLVDRHVVDVETRDWGHYVSVHATEHVNEHFDFADRYMLTPRTTDLRYEGSVSKVDAGDSATDYITQFPSGYKLIQRWNDSRGLVRARSLNPEGTPVLEVLPSETYVPAKGGVFSYPKAVLVRPSNRNMRATLLLIAEVVPAGTERCADIPDPSWNTRYSAFLFDSQERAVAQVSSRQLPDATPIQLVRTLLDKRDWREVAATPAPLPFTAVTADSRPMSSLVAVAVAAVVAALLVLVHRIRRAA